MLAPNHGLDIVTENNLGVGVVLRFQNIDGLMLIDGAYYYARTSGEIVTNRSYWITKTNDVLPAANYAFGADGQMINPPAA